MYFMVTTLKFSRSHVVDSDLELPKKEYCNIRGFTYREGRGSWAVVIDIPLWLVHGGRVIVIVR